MNSENTIPVKYAYDQVTCCITPENGRGTVAELDPELDTPLQLRLARVLVSELNGHNVVQLVEKLHEECKIMASRMQAILDTPEATDALCREDCFGDDYLGLVEQDVESLNRSLTMAAKYLEG